MFKIPLESTYIPVENFLVVSFLYDEVDSETQKRVREGTLELSPRSTSLLVKEVLTLICKECIGSTLHCVGQFLSARSASSALRNDFSSSSSSSSALLF